MAQNSKDVGYIVWEDDTSGWLMGASISEAGVGESFELVEDAVVPGIAVDEDRLSYATLFERWRSFTSAMRGLNAYLDRRNDDDRLVRIGLAGEAGAWRLTPLLAEIAPGELLTAHPRLDYVSPVARLGPQWDYVAEADSAALGAALDALETVADELTTPILRTVNPEAAYSGTHAAIMSALPERGVALLPHLQALALRATLRFEILEESGWH